MTEQVVPLFPEAAMTQAGSYLLPYVRDQVAFSIEIQRDQFPAYYSSHPVVLGRYVMQEGRVPLASAISSLLSMLSAIGKVGIMETIVPFLGNDWDGVSVDQGSPSLIHKKAFGALSTFCDYLAGGLVLSWMVRAEGRHCFDNASEVPAIPTEEAWRWAVYEAANEEDGTVLYLTNPVGPTLDRSTTTSNGVTLEKVRDLA